MPYRLFVKWPTQKTYRPVNWQTGYQVRNLIHATLFSEADKEKAEGELNILKNDNAGMVWYWRDTV